MPRRPAGRRELAAVARRCRCVRCVAISFALGLAERRAAEQLLASGGAEYLPALWELGPLPWRAAC